MSDTKVLPDHTMYKCVGWDDYLADHIADFARQYGAMIMMEIIQQYFMDEVVFDEADISDTPKNQKAIALADIIIIAVAEMRKVDRSAPKGVKL